MKLFLISIFCVGLLLLLSLFLMSDGQTATMAILQQKGRIDPLITYDQEGNVECDGLGITQVPFGHVVSTCGQSWFVSFWGRVITLQDDGGVAGRISRAIRVDQEEPMQLDRQVTNLPDGFHSAQAGSFYKLGDELTFVFVLQPNMNTPLLDLPRDVTTDWGGVLVSGDGGLHWQSFLMYQNPDVEGIVYRHNPVGMYVYEGQLIIDVADAAGAGSGEGQLTRFVLSNDHKEWLGEGCYYLVPEIYEQPDGPWSLAESDTCLELTLSD